MGSSLGRGGRGRLLALRDTYIVVALAALVAMISMTSVAYAYWHSTNTVVHGLYDDEPRVFVAPPISVGTFVAMRHYFSDGSWNEQCSVDNGFPGGYATCTGSWGTAPCQKRGVAGAEQYMSRNWQRRSGCAGSIHA
jgi:hypothetical protein